MFVCKARTLRIRPIEHIKKSKASDTRLLNVSVGDSPVLCKLHPPTIGTRLNNVALDLPTILQNLHG